MRKIALLGAFSVVAVLSAASVATAAPKKTCDEAAVASAKAAIDAACPCAGPSDGNGGTVSWKNHGQYMKCINKARKTEAHNAGMKSNCLNSVVPCAAGSTCGRSDAVACIDTIDGNCSNDPIPADGTAEGTCDNDPTKPCDTNADCPVATCSVLSPEDCTASGGSAATGTCCSQ
jgi:hypothetical protein